MASTSAHIAASDRDRAWQRTVSATAKHWAALEHLDEDDKQAITGLAQECFGQGYEAGVGELRDLRERLIRRENADYPGAG